MVVGGSKVSGGHFNYQQYRLEDIATTIDELIGTNDDARLEHGYPKGAGYSAKTIARFKEAAHTLRRARDMAQRVDWLVSGDDGEESFHDRLRANVMPKAPASPKDLQPTADPVARVAVEADVRLLACDRPWSEYPVGTKAHAVMGGRWLKMPAGWKWNGPAGSGGIFPTPGGDACGRCVELPPNSPLDRNS